MQVLCHDFGAKRAFLLKAAGPAKLLIYFQDFRSFSNPGIRRFLTDLDPSPPPHLFLHPFCSGPPTLSLSLLLSHFSQCWRLQFVNLNPFYSNTFTHTQTYPVNMEHTHTHSHMPASVCVWSHVGQRIWTLRQRYQSHRMLTRLMTWMHVDSQTQHVITGKKSFCGQCSVNLPHSHTVLSLHPTNVCRHKSGGSHSSKPRTT